VYVDVRDTGGNRVALRGIVDAAEETGGEWREPRPGAFRRSPDETVRGEVFGFLGPNGAGKTTTVRTLGTLLAPTSGSATVAGFPLTPENGVEIRRRIAIMPESPGLYLRLSILENLECFADLYEVSDPRGRIDLALRAVNLADRAQDACGTLSKGLRQRVALARALLSDPEILFLDEPTVGLDPVAAREVHELILGLRERGVTIFLTTHRLEEAERLCDRVAILNTTLRTIGRPTSCASSSSARRSPSGRSSPCRSRAVSSRGCPRSTTGTRMVRQAIAWRSRNRRLPCLP
jgi:ABC-type multidrug transport system ATPase subunit